MKLEEQVVRLDLAEQLKKASYSQNGLWWWHLGTDKKTWYVTEKEEGMIWVEDNYSCCIAPTVAEMGEAILRLVNEFSQGWNDSGDYWNFHAGNRGSGAMIEDIGMTFSASDEDSEADARALLWLQLKKRGKK